MKEKILEKIKQYDSIVIFGHLYPDGDCYGSQLGLKYTLQANFPEKKIYAVGSGFSRMLSLFGALDEVPNECIEESLAVLLDSSSLERMEDQRFSLAKEQIHIDHHVAKTPIMAISYVCEDAIATTQILTELFQSYGWQIPAKAGAALYLGLMTDSNRFLYQPNAAQLEVGAILLKTGFDIDAVYDQLYEVDEESLLIKGYYYSHFKVEKGVAYILFTKQELAALHITAVQATAYVNLLANIKDVPVWIAIAEMEDGSARCEFRSKKQCPIVQIAFSFGGGGHACAAGCGLTGLDQSQAVLLACQKEVEACTKKN